MVNQRVQLRFIKSIGLGVGAAAIVIAAGAVFAERAEQAQVRYTTVGQYHLLTIPEVDDFGPPDCTEERAAYAAAVAELRLVQAAADDAYAAWYRCLTGEDPPLPDPKPNPNPNPNAAAPSPTLPTYSILEK